MTSTSATCSTRWRIADWVCLRAGCVPRIPGGPQPPNSSASITNMEANLWEQIVVQIVQVNPVTAYYVVTHDELGMRWVRDEDLLPETEFLMGQ